MHKYAIVMNTYTKEKRRQVLRDIVAKHGIGDQHHLQTELARRGIDITQATISRDLQDMGYVKVRLDSGAYRYDLYEKTPEGSVWPRLKFLFKNFVTEIKSTENLVLIKTSPGNANGVASLIDALRREEVLGTVAGDDTILVVVDSREHRKAVAQSFEELLG
jgi:transcriptional regulator of arginine metabolism